MELAFSCHAVNLRDRVVLLQDRGSFHQGVRRQLNFKIAGNRSADFLRVDDRRVFLNNPFLFQRLYACSYRYPGQSYFFTNIGIRDPGVLDQQL